MTHSPSPRVLAWARLTLFLLCLLPLAALVGVGITGAIGPNPVEVATHTTGEWGLRLLLVTLAVTPLRRLTGWAWLLRFRRMLGLFAFFYLSLHLATYLALDQFFDWAAIAEDVRKRPYITAGFTAFVLLVPLAATSTRGMVRRLGRRWQNLHRLIYPAAALGVLHFLWLTKADLREPMIYAGILVLLLALRWPGRARQSPNVRAGLSAAAPPPERSGSRR
ncbi:MAG: sulfoxide reductase heme-binding subunit YedZ [Chromatiaceae bacterium]|jgi:sulfoxide reductase heme-binding subunit YedZ|nr:sulfoxide reductase heme-binding subunit YedZ [Chromatiaceae bacterium]